MRAEPGVHFEVGEALITGAHVERKLLLEPWYLVLSDGAAHQDIDALQNDPRVGYAEIDTPIVHLEPTDEPLFDQQWALENLPSKGGHWDADVDATVAWQFDATGAGIIVAVLDTGVKIDITELAGQIWTNPNEIPNNGVDDDENGLIDDVNGANTVWLNGDINDPDGHGTACASLIGAAENQQGMIGLAYEATIMPVRIFGLGDEGSFVSHAADGITYATNHGARVLSNSWTTGTGKKRLITEAIEYAHDNEVLFIAAAGNSSVDADVEGFFPASSKLDNVISVGASDRFDLLIDRPGLWGSTYGLSAVDLTAPGEGILAPTLEEDLQLFAGTSAAAPLVAATAALLLSRDPTLSNLAVKELILDSVDHNNSATVSEGRLNAGNALRLLVDGVGPFYPEIEITGEIGHEHVLDLSVAGATECSWFLPDISTFAEGPTLSYAVSQPGEWMVGAECVSASGQLGRAQRLISVPIPWRQWDLSLIESAHDSVDEGIVTLHAPSGTLWARFHFSQIDLNSAGIAKADAYVTLYDAEQLWVWSATGQNEDLWTPPLRGELFTLYWSIEESALPSWGFELDAAETWRDEIPFPLELSAELPTSVISEETGCQHGQGLRSSLPWLMLLLLFPLRAGSGPKLTNLKH